MMPPSRLDRYRLEKAKSRIAGELSARPGIRFVAFRTAEEIGGDIPEPGELVGYTLRYDTVPLSTLPDPSPPEVRLQWLAGCVTPVRDLRSAYAVVGVPLWAEIQGISPGWVEDLWEFSPDHDLYVADAATRTWVAVYRHEGLYYAFTGDFDQVPRRIPGSDRPARLRRPRRLR